MKSVVITGSEALTDVLSTVKICERLIGKFSN